MIGGGYQLKIKQMPADGFAASISANFCVEAKWNINYNYLKYFYNYVIIKYYIHL